MIGKAEDFYLRKLTLDDLEEIKPVMIRYMTEEQLAKCLKLTQHEKEIFVEKYLQLALPQGMCVGMFEATSKKVSGFGLVTSADSPLSRKTFPDDGSTPRLHCILEFDEFTMEKLKVNELIGSVGADKVMMLDHLFVDPQYQGRGLADRAHVWIDKVAEERGFKLMILECTSYFSQRLTLKNEFTSMGSVNYADYRDPVTGEAVFADIPPPHTGTMMLHKLVLPSKY